MWKGDIQWLFFVSFFFEGYFFCTELNRGTVVKVFHYIVLGIVVVLLLFGHYDEYQAYSGEGIRVKSYEYGMITRVYVSDQKMIQVVETDGYNENLIFLVAIEKGQIVDFKVISHQETDDYGDYITEDWFEDRMKVDCSQPLEVVKLAKEKPNQIVAITGATITTDAIVKGMNNCIDNYWRYLK